MAFDEVRLPVEVERGATGGPGFLTNVALLNSGKEQRNSLWSVDRGEWNIGYGIQTRDDALAVRNFFMARLGRARGFRFRDWTNYTTYSYDTRTHEPQICEAEADGVLTTFQMSYAYADTGGFFYRKEIFKPVSATVEVFVDGVSQSSGVTVDSTTGIITFDDPPAYGSDVTWTGEFDLPVRFDTDTLNLSVVTKNVINAPSIQIVELKL